MFSFSSTFVLRKKKNRLFNSALVMFLLGNKHWLCVCFFCHCSRARQVYVNRYGIISKMCCWLKKKRQSEQCIHYAIILQRGARYTCHWRYMHKILLKGCIINREREMGECFSCRTNYPKLCDLKHNSVSWLSFAGQLARSAIVTQLSWMSKMFHSHGWVILAVAQSSARVVYQTSCL